MIILYGSQTGNSIHISELIQNAILFGYNEETLYNLQTSNASLNIKNFYINMDSFDFTKILEIKTIIFVCSTHGNGTEPFNMSKFWKLLRNKNLPQNFLSHLNFAIFGLGDSAYKSYNYCSKKLYNCLLRHGAHPIIRKGSGDSQDKEGFMTDYKKWIKELYPLIKDLYLQDANKYLRTNTKLYDATLVKKRFLTHPEYKHQILELEFSILNYEDFNVGDCLAFYPLNYNQDEFMKFNNIIDVPLNLDFNSIPQSYFFLQLSNFIENSATEEVKTKIREIYDNYDLYYEYVLLPKRNIFEVLKDFNIKLTSTFLKNIPLINPRYFTLTKKKTSFFITVSLVHYQTSIKAKRKGLCSEYLKNVYKIDKVAIISNKLDMSKKKLFFICTGTGITLPRACNNFYKNKDILVLYGYRDRKKDLLYEEEFKEVKMIHAVSQNDKKYVQDVFKETFSTEKRIFEEFGDIDDWSIFVSGNSRLNDIVDKMLIEVFKKKILFQTETW